MPILKTWKLVASVQPTQQQLVDYMNAAAAVNLYAYAITQQDMPLLHEPPNNYGDFTQSFSPAKAHCLEWTNDIFPTILSFPTTIVDANAIFNLENSELGAALQILQSDPTNQQAKAALGTALTATQKIVQAQLATGQQLVTNLGTFNTNIQADANTLSTIAAAALADVGADQTKIAALTQSINNLNSDINTLQKWLTISEIGIGVSIFVGLIGIVCCVIPGLQGAGIGLIVVAVAGEAASIAGTVLTTKAIAADNAEIASEQTQISDLNQDVILLQALNTQFKYLVTANQNAQQAMATVVQMWTNLDQAITEVITELTDVSNDVTAAQYVQAGLDLQAANTAWQQLVQFAQALGNVNYNWIDAQGNTHSFSQQAPAIDSSQITQPSSAPKTAAAVKTGGAY